MGGRYSNRGDEGHEVRVVHHHYLPQKSGGTAALLEVLFGLFFQTFGIGHIYAGHVVIGLLFMFGYWFVLLINTLLCFVMIGFITLLLCWSDAMVLSPIIAASSCSSR